MNLLPWKSYKVKAILLCYIYSSVFRVYRQLRTRIAFNLWGQSRLTRHRDVISYIIVFIKGAFYLLYLYFITGTYPVSCTVNSHLLAARMTHTLCLVTGSLCSRSMAIFDITIILLCIIILLISTFSLDAQHLLLTWFSLIFICPLLCLSVIHSGKLLM